MSSSGICFVFFKQKTAYELRISDWSSDVCSSDLITVEIVGYPLPEDRRAGGDAALALQADGVALAPGHAHLDQLQRFRPARIFAGGDDGLADRKSVV